MTDARGSTLPHWPARLGEDLAASYLGISKTTFRDRVGKRVYPQPIREGKRLLWAKVQLDRFVEAQFGILPANESGDAGDASWADLR